MTLRHSVACLKVSRSICFSIILLALAACQGKPSRALELAAQAEAQRQAGALDAARRSIDAAIAERDDIALLYVEKARIALARDALVEAFEAYANASALDTTNMEALQGIAQLGLAVGRLDEADAAADQILVILPSEPNALFTKGLVTLARRRGEAAMGYADTILKITPRDVRGLVLKARTLFFLGRTGEALAGLDRATAGETAPDPALAATYLELHREQRDAPAMLRDFAVINAAGKGSPALRLDEANLRYKTGDVAGARRILSGLLVAPRLAPATMTRVVALWQQYDEDPVPAAAQATATGFGTPLARIETARLYLDRGAAQRAIALLGREATPGVRALVARAVLAVRPDAPAVPAAVRALLAADATQCDALLARAEMAHGRKDTGRALADVQRVIAECPGNSGGYRLSARLRRAAGDEPGEFRAYDLALTNIPQDVSIARSYFDRAVVLGQTDRVLAIGRQVTRSVPSWPAGWAMLAAACTSAGDAACRADAERRGVLARTIYELDPLPGEPRARSLLGRLQR